MSVVGMLESGASGAVLGPGADLASKFTEGGQTPGAHTRTHMHTHTHNLNR